MVFGWADSYLVSARGFFGEVYLPAGQRPKIQPGLMFRAGPFDFKVVRRERVPQVQHLILSCEIIADRRFGVPPTE